MSKRYEPQNIEKKWQKIWQDEKAFAATDDYTKPKYYALVEFPYPSGQGLHVGHPRPYTALDIVARKRRMQGYNVLYPMGWDAFGLPTENYAIKNHIHPKIVTKSNVHHFKDQLQSLGYSFDWDREINTTDPEYYHWTQWIFLKLFKAGLAYKKEMPINWCTSCKVGLANEEVVNGVCERCGSPVVRKVKSAVSYTHLKRRRIAHEKVCNRFSAGVLLIQKCDVSTPVSYTHLDVYKRQGRRKADTSGSAETENGRRTKSDL